MSFTSEMVLIASKTGSKVVTVACPKCGRISRQISEDEYNSQPILALRSTHSCPICESNYSMFSVTGKADWSAAYIRYERQGEQSYNNMDGHH